MVACWHRMAARVRALVLVEMRPSVYALFSVWLRPLPSSTLPRLRCGLRVFRLAFLPTGSTSMDTSMEPLPSWCL